MPKLNSKLISFITGGGDGLGKATAKRLLKHGCKVAVVDMNEESLYKLKSDSQIENKGNLLTIAADVTNESDVQRAVDQTLSKFGRLNASLSCAGSFIPVDFVGLDTSIVRNTFDLHFYGQLYTAKYASAAMMDNEISENGDRGAIIFTSSLCADEGSSSTFAYSAAKGAIKSMLFPMARELSAHSIRVNAIAPGSMATDLIYSLPRKIVEEIEDAIPRGKLGDPDDFASLAGHLFENPHITAQHIRLDGGQAGVFKRNIGAADMRDGS